MRKNAGKIAMDVLRRCESGAIGLGIGESESKNKLNIAMDVLIAVGGC